MKNVGDKIASVATPVARMFHMDCIDPSTQQLKPESRCNQTRLALNEWFNKKAKGLKVKYRIQLDIEAIKLSDIDQKQIEAVSGGEIISININPAPNFPTPIQRPAQSPALAARMQPGATPVATAG